MKSKTDFYLKKLHPLVGGKITALARSGPSDDPFEDEFFGFEVTLPNGKKKTVILLADDEGNGPGSFDIQEG